jgi:multidrug efflux pump subunit AcrA (membrane-fusion protein)
VGRGALIIATWLAIAASIGGCKKAPPPPPTAPTVRVVTLKTRDVEQIREWLATLDGSTNADIRPQVSGYIQQVNYAEGSEVKNGALLFTLDKRPFVAAVEKAKGDLQNAIAQRNKSRDDVNRYTPLVAEHAIS